MSTVINSFELWKLRVPMGRVIGDCGCQYDAAAVVAVGLKSSDGHVGWGFGETPWGGRFVRGADWIKPMPARAEIVAGFEAAIWPELRGRSLVELKERRPNCLVGGEYVEQAVRMAIWDLLALEANVPLSVYLGAKQAGGRIRAYGSGLEFNSSDEEARAIHRKYVNSGLTAVKVKVGHPDIEGDVHRLRVVRGVIGKDVEMAIDANEQWTCDEAIRRVERFQKEGLNLSYVEDALPRTDVEGAARLNRTIEIDLVGHDYISDPRDLRPFLDRGAFSRIRVGPEVEQALAAAKLAAEYKVPLIFGNSQFEMGIHAAVAFADRVDRIEFSDLAWNDLPAHPVSVRDGFMYAPTAAGHGLAPDPEKLARMSHAGASEAPVVSG
jgi:L-alanine-DL-glutamate epimerase-like enolase superfamily enzyme